MRIDIPGAGRRRKRKDAMSGLLLFGWRAYDGFMEIAVLVVDVHQSMVDEGPWNSAIFLDRCGQVIRAARQRGAEVVHVMHSDGPGSGFEPGAPGWELHPMVAPLEGERVFVKEFNSAFRRTGLEAYLRERGIGRLVLMGMQTEYCIDTTCRVAFEKEFELVMPEGTNTTFDNGGLRAELIVRHHNERIFKGRFASMPSVEAVVAALGEPD
jgi:nicotinamidase-related amidase